MAAETNIRIKVGGGPARLLAAPEAPAPTKPAATRPCDYRYFRGLPGILRILELVLSFVALIIAGVATYPFVPGFPSSQPNARMLGSAGFFIFLSLTSVIGSAVMLFVHLTGRITPRKRLLQADLIFCCVFAALFVFASIAVVACINHSSMSLGIFDDQVVITVFGFIIALALIVHLSLLIKALQLIP